MQGCPAPWYHLSIDASGRMAPCCIYDQGPVAYDLSQPGTSIREGLNAFHHTSARRLMAQGRWPVECSLCKLHEDAGVTSKRQFLLRLPENRAFDPHQAAAEISPEGTVASPRITSMFLELGNVCNLECPSCGPQSSTRWYDLNRRLNKRFQLGLEVDKVVYTWHRRPEIIEELKGFLCTVETIQFAGGEPFLDRTHSELLEHCIRLGRAGEIDIRYNTNGTILPAWLRELWGAFRRVFVYFSCDGFDDPSVHYLRHPATWTRIRDNIRQLRTWPVRQWKLGLYATINCLNVYYIPEIVAMSKAEELNPWLMPVHHDLLDVRVLPRLVKQRVKDRLEQTAWNDPRIAQAVGGILTLMFSEDWSGRAVQLIEDLDRFDAVRGTDYRIAFPELTALLRDGCAELPPEVLDRTNPC